MADTFADIRVHSRVVHRRGGRGKVVHLYAGTNLAAVLFDGDGTATKVELRDLTPMPDGMPSNVPDPLGFVRTPYRVVWSPERSRIGGRS